MGSILILNSTSKKENGFKFGGGVRFPRKFPKFLPFPVEIL